MGALDEVDHRADHGLEVVPERDAALVQHLGLAGPEKATTLKPRSPASQPPSE